ncbi:type VI secretion system Vgr family protein [Aerolutibacter ruishenii]|uniref:Putative type VI secretion system Rhs element Vgr protein n=1 Tax=Aerolutibacter ruishenii TaxID=686800 RepID=A0A562M1W8_9GAMM|nr:type VI secretion system Vgr family protein [Lysobacter ruishenii]TWI13601.1 putative type VI secretion system Rhs element Vgr protein [Lysobacter ruishenii]
MYRKRSLTTQYGESDLAFVERLLAEEGIAYWFEHEGAASAIAGGSGSGAHGDATLGTHTLVLGDHPEAFGELGAVRHHRSDATERHDGVHNWSIARRWRPVQIRRGSWDYKALAVRATEAGGGVGGMTVVDDDTAGPYAWSDRETGHRYARQQAEALQVGAQTGQGAGTWRHLRAGARFQLVDAGWGGWLGSGTGHGDGARAGTRGGTTGDGAYTCLRVHHCARNNLGAEIFAAVGRALGPIAMQAPALPEAWADDVQRGGDFSSSRAFAGRLGDCGANAANALRGSIPSVDAALSADASTAVATFAGRVRDAVGLGDVLGADEPGAYFYQNAFEAIPAALPYRAITVDGHGVRRHPRPTAHGTQTAIVVSDGAPQLTDRDHRIKVQFPWQRGGNAGNRLSHPSSDDNAPAIGAAWTWVRVAGPWAGDNWGSVFVPRQGQEVLVAFLEGDIDRPVVIGAVYNGQGQADAAHNRIGASAAGATGNAPAWFDGNEHLAVFTGIKSQQLAESQGGGGGYQQLRLDDTPGQGRVQAETTQYASGLTLGHLKAGTDNVRGAERGFGVELTTQASGALRAGAGLLLSTERGRQQLSADGALQQLRQGEQLLQGLQDAAKAQHATLPGEGAALPAQQALRTLQESLQAVQRGSAPGDGIGGGEGEAPGWSAPAIVASSPDGIVSVTPADQVWAAGQQATLSAEQDLQWLTQGEAVLATAGGIVLYAHGNPAPAGKPNQERGIALHAAQGAVSVRAHKHLARVAALTQVTIASTQADVSVAAGTHVLATAAGAYLRLKGADIELGAPGKIEFKATRKNLTGPRSASPDLPELPKTSGDFAQSFALFSLEGVAPEGAKAILFDPDQRGGAWEGQADASGVTTLDVKKAGRNGAR